MGDERRVAVSLLSLPKERPYLEAPKQVGFEPLMLLVMWEVGPHGLLMGGKRKE